MRPTEFASQLNISLANGWGIVRSVADMCMKMPEGKYVLVKDPNKVGIKVIFIFILLTAIFVAGDPSIRCSYRNLYR